MSDRVRVPNAEETPVVSVPEGGRILANLGRAASYAAAQRGELPTIRVGRRLVVPVARLRALLGLDATTDAA
jgi:hypothetical protein